MVTTALHGSDDKLKADGIAPRYPYYTYEDELPREPLEQPGASAGMFFDRHSFGGPFLARWRAPYTNYGWQDYQNYSYKLPIYPQYDSFGNFISSGYPVFALEEYRSRAPEVGSLMHKGRFYQNWLRHLVIADDAYKGWSTRLMVGDFISTTFTPLILDMANFNGLRFDAISSGHHAFTLLVSRISDPIKLHRTDDLTGIGRVQNVNDGVYLVGGHWETNVGGALVLGVSYVNLYRYDSQRSFNANSRKGLAPQNTVPQQIIVRFEDDDPNDPHSGAAVFDIKATVTSIAGPGTEEGERTTTLLLPASVQLSPGAVQRARHIEVRGVFRNEEGREQPVFVDYTFSVPPEAVDVQFAALVANDYKISVRQNHFYDTDPLRGSGQHRETAFAMVRRAAGKVTDMSNRGMVYFDYGLATGVEVLGVNARLRLPGLQVTGEFVRSNNHLQYPTLLGERSQFDDTAGYLVTARQWSRFDIGAEIFRVGPRFTSYNPHPAERDPVLGEVFYFNEPRQAFYRNPGIRTSNPYYALVDDNDNMLYNQTPNNWLVMGMPLETSGGSTGIFPFFDLNQDGHPDTNRNRNEYADYHEPFLMYYVDPEEFYYGDDFNNNFFTDIWEVDRMSNYPYYKDERGIHLRSGCKLVQGLYASVGFYKVRQLAAGGKNDVVYGRLHLDRRLANHWRVRWEHESKQVEDDIPNDYYRYLLREGVGGYTETLVKDRLEARDSFINRGLLRVDCQPLAAWRVEGKLRYELNHQHERRFADGTYQREDDINFYGAVLRTEYRRRWGNFVLMPRLKILYRLHERTSLVEPTIEQLQIIPILRADYQLTHSSQIRLGLQGLPGLRDHRRDLVNPMNDVEHTTWALTWLGQSEYEGYRIGTEIGIRREHINFAESQRDDVRYTRMFVRMISAVGVLVR